ncbi:UDP-3-O-(3-hydroxymyristoyl)glucosamine N-acyltransferase [Taibaiella chishuiensis]|uniref:UDP-3-O-[3-hydroxymyristoyl] glucosamine N-acyltransferase n=1 Tax=Taibaiella chishuiensis TaxID=1434707 RepID=A0A2P8DB86_9BACT|nr:UDP-3-O-(3-hydroxymyristoyl)glucosamine N-acyltransferase [Taibaiella chishuiensis]PSK94474.1 UDP-3-O-[3-hydroxymyristoyl] glucosamine N-acyltransferase [Taibaiella chishuiensis]
MRFETPVAAAWIASYIDAKLVGDESLEATGINEIHKVVPGDISFVDFEKYYNKSLHSAATFIIINKEVPRPEGKVLFVCDDPFAAYVKIVKRFRPFEPATQMISASASIGSGTQVQPGVFVGNHVTIGKDCLIHPNVTIYDHSVIGDNVIIHAGAVIGADAYYYKRRKERQVQYDKLESCGRVIIHNDVEIGAGTTIDKGVSGDTIIGEGTKIDNHVHIGHGAVIGKNCLFAAQVGIGGKAIIEDEVILWGQVGVSKDLTIGKGAVVYAQSGVASSIEGGKTYFGSPVEEAKTKMRELNWIKRIPELWERVTKP